jgi:hypothetical protein
MNRATLLGIVGVSAAAVGGGVFLVAWSFTPATAEAQLVASLDPGGTATGPGGRHHGSGRVTSRRPHPTAASAPRTDRPRPEGTADAESRATKAPRTIAEEARARNLDDEERAALRREIREERLVDVNARLDAFAGEAGWDDTQTEDIRMLLIDTADHITQVLARVDRREVEWDAVKGELRTYRETQAASVRRAIGNQDFDTFVERMDFARFFEDAPIRGRIE